MRYVNILIFLLIVLVFGTLIYWFYHPSSNKNTLIVYGNVDVRQVDLGFRVSGRVIKMPFQEGEVVKAGDFMAELDHEPYLDQVKQAENQIRTIRVNLANAERLLKRRIELKADGSVAQEDYDNALATRDALQTNLDESLANLGVQRTNLNDTKIFAPNEGTILTRIREPGTVVKVADPVYTLSLLDPVWVRAFISEPYLGVVYPGMPAEVHTDTREGKVYKGHVGFISPVAEFTPKTVETTQLRTDLVYRLRVIVDNPDQGLRQGMPVTVKFQL